ncbi:hypothetical protein GCM10007881_55290 [Mesorhizobium huakuii]|uniref:hypothetical protein n=1 Tax=Mesorhizobium huakuii TaxID=28104 RepID=UPI00235D3945|nr:hypothetical protein [Mesorhizobium huakuii]GLQ82008.1 hypothetical protein GCM10007881_55290 [Mesorhizobium huakuii]
MPPEIDSGLPATPVARHLITEENVPIVITLTNGRGDKKGNLKHLKSPYRDAAFRHVFQGLDALEELEEDGATSVTVLLPLPSPSTPTATSSPSTATPTPYVRESLSPKDAACHERFWQSFSVYTGLAAHDVPAVWRDLSDLSTLEWFHHSLRHTGPVHSFTLNLSPDIDRLARTKRSAVKWLSRRIDRQLKLALGRPIDFWFAVELTQEGQPRRLHCHGELQIASSDSLCVRKALRIAGGEWEEARQFQAHTRPAPNVGWSHYVRGLSVLSGVVPYRGRFKNMKRPINGDWFASTNAVRSAASSLYTARRGQVLSLLKNVSVV